MGDYEPKTGDRVRVVLEGRVDDGYVEFGTAAPSAPYLATQWFLPSLKSHAVSIEKIAPALPTTPGSVVLCKQTGLYNLRTDAGWVNEFGDRQSDTAFDTRGHDHLVIFDAGAA